MNRLSFFFSACSRLVLMGIFWIAVRLFYDVEFHGLEHVRGKRPSYFAMAHKRDLRPDGRSAIGAGPPGVARDGRRRLLRDAQ